MGTSKLKPYFEIGQIICDLNTPSTVGPIREVVELKSGGVFQQWAYNVDVGDNNCYLVLECNASLPLKL